ncbi:MAG: glycosyltransferase family 2 protein [Phycisphaerae bacterium]|nr:glycosyltransferase family 2 protein [Phycisphaerae bacterium]
MKDSYSISVVIPAYNCGKYLARAIDSVLAQRRAADEIIVVDDGSTDNTAEVAARYGGRIRFLQQANAGASAARNTGIEAAMGEWVAFLDADDEWLPTKLQMQAAVLERHPQLAWATGNYIGCTCLTEQRSAHVPVEKARALTRGEEVVDFFGATVKDIWGCTDTMLVRRHALLEAGLFTPGLAWGEDFDMWWRIAYRYPKIGYVAEPLAVYHLDVEGSVIRTYQDAAATCALIERHLGLSREHGRLAAFEPCAAFLLRRWMRSMLFEARGREVRGMLKQFGGLLPGWYKAFMGLFAAFPKATAAGCRGISWFVRTFKLRKSPVRSRRAAD